MDENAPTASPIEESVLPEVSAGLSDNNDHVPISISSEHAQANTEETSEEVQSTDPKIVEENSHVDSSPAEGIEPLPAVAQSNISDSSDSDSNPKMNAPTEPPTSLSVVGLTPVGTYIAAGTTEQPVAVKAKDAVVVPSTDESQQQKTTNNESLPETNNNNNYPHSKDSTSHNAVEKKKPNIVKPNGSTVSSSSGAVKTQTQTKSFRDTTPMRVRPSSTGRLGRPVNSSSSVGVDREGAVRALKGPPAASSSSHQVIFN